MSKKKKWYEREHQKSKEITIKLNVNHLKHAIYILIILCLVGIVIGQHYGLIPVSENAVGAGTKIAENKQEENKTPGVTITKPNGTRIIQEFNDSEDDIEEDEVDTENNVTNESEENEEKLPITGEIILNIDEVNIDPKENIEDYARIESVKFTIKNQDEDFVPKVVGYINKYKGDEEKTVVLNELKAGERVILTEEEFNFGYNCVDEEHILTLELYKDKKLIKKESKSFIKS